MNQPDRAIDPGDQLRLQAKLDRNETLVWLGRPVPTFRYRGWFGTVLCSIPWCAVTGVFVSAVLVPAWMGEDSAWGPLGLWAKLGLTAFLSPFVAIGIGMLFSPLWHKLSQAGTLYAVTDRRALLAGRFSIKSWRASQMFEPDRADHRNGLTDVWFTYGKATNGVPPPAGFTNLPAADADAAVRALRAIKGLPRA